MHRGDLWWAETERAGRRPALVLTRSATIPHLPVVLVAFATTVVRGLDTEVPLDPADGVPVPCVLNLDTPELVPRSLLVERIGHLDESRMHAVCEALGAAVDC